MISLPQAVVLPRILVAGPGSDYESGSGVESHFEWIDSCSNPFHRILLINSSESVSLSDTEGMLSEPHPWM